MPVMPVSRAMARYGVFLALAISATLVPETLFAQPPGGPRPRTLTEMGESASPGVEIPDDLGAEAVKHATAGGLPVESRGNWGMSQRTTPEQAKAAVELAKCPRSPAR